MRTRIAIRRKGMKRVGGAEPSIMRYVRNDTECSRQRRECLGYSNRRVSRVVDTRKVPRVIVINPKKVFGVTEPI